MSGGWVAVDIALSSMYSITKIPWHNPTFAGNVPVGEEAVLLGQTLVAAWCLLQDYLYIPLE